jgi:uncharacterized membrane protein
MSINSNEGQNPDQSNSYGGGYGGYSGGYQAPSSAQQPYDPNDPYADRSGPGTYAGYDQQQASAGQQQQQQEQTFYQPPDSATRRQRTSTSSSSTSTMKMAPNKAAIFSYALGWVSGLIFLVMERKNSFVRFSAAQSFLFFGGVTILQVILRLIGAIPFLGTILLAPILGLVGTVITIAALAAWLFLLFQAYRGVKVKIPIVGDYAEALVARFTPKV